MNLLNCFIPHYILRFIPLAASLLFYPAYAQDVPPAVLDSTPTQRSTDIAQNVQTRFQQATRLAQEGRDDEALQAFQQLIERYPELPESYNNLAALYAKKEQYAQARAVLETAISANPNYPLAYQNLGTVYMQLAMEAYQQAATRDKRNVHAKQLQQELQILLRKMQTQTIKNSAVSP